MAYKGSGKKGRIQNSGQKRSSYGKKPSTGFSGAVGDLFSSSSGRPSKKQSGSGGNSRKTHGTKGKNTHGRRSW